MTAAVIDLGTNTFHLIIAEVANSSVHVLYKTNVPVKLGEGRINEHIIIPAAFERGIQTLKTFQETIIAYGATTVKVIATSAVRSASNGTEFVRAAREQAGIDIEVITGDQEAAYIFNGVKATGVIRGLSLIMDIGGGSTEFIICDDEQLLWKKSYDIGAARLMQAYFKSDPISQSDQQAITDHLDKELMDLKEACSFYQPKHLIGSAGAFETFASMLIKELDVKSIKSTPLDLNAYQALSKKLITSTHDERDAMPDLIKLRVDMIVIASILSSYIIKHIEIGELSLSTYDLKMGVLHTLTSSKS
ncbi:MAG: exopolyphosphatase [Pedobacter sp.]|nr:MAG: exopolyphosphatase [Pedobacter sp.]